METNSDMCVQQEATQSDQQVREPSLFQKFMSGLYETRNDDDEEDLDYEDDGQSEFDSEDEFSEFDFDEEEETRDSWLTIIWRNVKFF